MHLNIPQKYTIRLMYSTVRFTYFSRKILRNVRKKIVKLYNRLSWSKL